MRYIDLGCNMDCWKCNEKCNLKTILTYSAINPFLEPVVNSVIMDKLRAEAGLLMSQGIDFNDVNEDVKMIAVSLYVARLKIREQLLENRNH